MRLIPDGELGDFANERDIGFKTTTHIRVNFLGKEAETKQWPFPDDCSAYPWFISKFLEAADPWIRCWVYPPAGEWFGRNGGGSVMENIWAEVLIGLGVPRDFKGALCFDISEFEKLVAVLYLEMSLGTWSYGDVSIVPDSKAQILHLGNHDTVSVDFYNPERIDSFIEFISENDIDQPMGHVNNDIF